ncbi:MAG: hypothetical protein HQL79_12595, partial [Magnetococcales bacterium]|nr:hypothetical protein [Magnetococcales bacterium]
VSTVCFDDVHAEWQAKSRPRFPGGAKGKDGGSGEEMVEWFFFNGVNAKAAGTTVGVEDHLVVVSRADEADSLLIF